MEKIFYQRRTLRKERSHEEVELLDLQQKLFNTYRRSDSWALRNDIKIEDSRLDSSSRLSPRDAVYPSITVTSRSVSYTFALPPEVLEMIEVGLSAAQMHEAAMRNPTIEVTPVVSTGWHIGQDGFEESEPLFRVYYDNGNYTVTYGFNFNPDHGETPVYHTQYDGPRDYVESVVKGISKYVTGMPLETVLLPPFEPQQ